jgi:cytochrome b involved in lipid metabolism
MKVAASVGSFTPPVPKVKTLLEHKLSGASLDSINKKEQAKTTVAVVKATPKTTITKTVGATTPSTPSATPASTSASNTCIITLFGLQYDVTELRNTHSGGDVFNCGTDETQSYVKQHGSSVSRMSKYLVTNTASSTTGSSQANTNSTQKATTTGCIVTIFGTTYDVTSLRGSHPGGDIFKCGTDMSNSYKSEHGTNVSMLQKYIVTGSGSGSTTSSSQTSSRSDDDDDDDEDDDRDEEDDDDDEDEDEWEDEKEEWEDEWEKAKEDSEDDEHDEDD